MSPFNEFATTLPKLITPSGNWAYLTANKFLSPRVSPYQLIAYVRK